MKIERIKKKNTIFSCVSCTWQRVLSVFVSASCQLKFCYGKNCRKSKNDLWKLMHIIIIFIFSVNFVPVERNKWLFATRLIIIQKQFMFFLLSFCYNRQRKIIMIKLWRIKIILDKKKKKKLTLGVLSDMNQYNCLLSL